MADGIRRMPSFGSPKREGQHERTRRSTGGVARSQFDPRQGGIGARVHRHRRLRHRSPHWPPSDRQPLLLEVRLSGFPEALAEVLGHRVGAGRRHLWDTSPTELSDACNGAEPAHAVLNTAAGEGVAPPPLDPLAFRAARGAADARGRRPRIPPPVR